MNWKEAEKIKELVAEELIKDFSNKPLEETFKYQQGRNKLKPKSIKFVKEKIFELRKFLGITNYNNRTYYLEASRIYWYLKQKIERHYKQAFLKTIKTDKGMTIGKIIQKTSNNNSEVEEWYIIKDKGDREIKKNHHKKPLAYAINDFTKKFYLILQTDKKTIAYRGEFTGWRANIYEISLKEAYEEIKKIIEHKFEYEANLKELKNLAVIDYI